MTREETEAVLNALPDASWRLAFALCRYGGLRCPSELVRLTWADVSWDRARFTVHASKTEHHADAGIRVVPIFAELQPYFREAFEAADPGEVTCCPDVSEDHPGGDDGRWREALAEALSELPGLARDGTRRVVPRSSRVPVDWEQPRGGSAALLAGDG